MQSVTNTFTAESRSLARKPKSDFQVSWQKQFEESINFFTIGQSTIGGNDVIKGEGNVIQEWNKYVYQDETSNLMRMEWERSLNQPLGGLAAALADGALDNTDDRYTPHYMGGNSELFTAVLPRRPAIINAGFEVGGNENTLPQFVGLFTKQPKVMRRQKRMEWQAADFIDFLKNRYVDETTMFTAQRTDQVLDTILQDLGYSTAQYELDTGINKIPFGIFKKGEKWANIVNELVQAEYGHFYQDEEGVLRFENRQHWDSSPHNTNQMVISTADVLEAEAPDTDHIINVVEVISHPRRKESKQKIWELPVNKSVGSGEQIEIFADFTDDEGEMPILRVDDPVEKSSATTSFYNTDQNVGDLNLKSSSTFSTAYKMVFENTGDVGIEITELVLYGEPAKLSDERIYTREQDDSSVTAFEERPKIIENDYIQDEDWAESFAKMILKDYGEIENLQKITIRAQPQLQLGDRISWQGRSWIVFGIKTRFDRFTGFVQDLDLLQREITTYFRIGISTIGGEDKISP